MAAVRPHQVLVSLKTKTPRRLSSRATFPFLFYLRYLISIHSNKLTITAAFALLPLSLTFPAFKCRATVHRDVGVDVDGHNENHGSTVAISLDSVEPATEPSG